MYLVKENKLTGVISAIDAPTASTAPSAETLGAFTGALLVYLFTLSFLSQEQGLWLTGIIVLGALSYNQKKMGANSLINTLFKPLPTS